MKLNFLPRDTRTIGNLAKWGSFVAYAWIISTVLGGLTFVEALGSEAHGGWYSNPYASLGSLFIVMSFVTMIALGLFLLRACAAFRHMVKSFDDDDADHLLAGMNGLRQFFMGQAIVGFVGLGLVALATLFTLSRFGYTG